MNAVNLEEIFVYQFFDVFEFLILKKTKIGGGWIIIFNIYSSYNKIKVIVVSELVSNSL